VTDSRTQQKIDEFEGLRGLMAWWVVLGHLAQALNLSIPLIVRNTLAVQVFIILSGFVISYLLDTKREPYARYIVRRGFRLFPLYLTVLALSALTMSETGRAIAALPFGGSHNADRLALVRSGETMFWPHLLAHIPLAQGMIPPAWLPDAPYTLVGQAWSISLEWQFYLVAPFLARACRSLAGKAAFLAFALILSATPTMIGDAFLLDRIGCFALGIASFWLFRAVPSQPALRRIPAIALGLLLAALAVTRSIDLVPPILWAATLAATGCFDPAGRLSLLSRLLNSRPVLGEGRRSYSIYMVHMLVLWGVAGLCAGRIADQRLLMALIAGGTVLGTMLLARLSYRWIEQPGIAMGSRIGRAMGRPLVVAEATR
jgi:peptidoglycan/LPS O-acetylase OafA/YrhL